MNAAPNKKKRPRTFTDAVRLLEAEEARCRASAEYHLKVEKAESLHRAISFLKGLNPVKRKRRSGVAGSHSNGQNGGAE